MKVKRESVHTHTSGHTYTHTRTNIDTKECVGGGLVMLTGTDNEPSVNVLLSFGYDIMAL